MNHRAVSGVLDAHIHGVADANAQHRSGDAAVERPIAERGAFREAAFEFNRIEIDPHRLRRPVADRRRNLGRFLRDVGFDQDLSGRSRRDDELSAHARQFMTGNAAQIGEIAGARGAEGDGRARAAADNAWRLRILLREYDVVLGAFAVDQDDLDHLSLRGRKNRIDLSVDGAADAEIDHPSFRNARTQCVAGIRHVGRTRAGTSGADGCAGAAAGGCARCATAGAPAGDDGRNQIGDHILALVRGLQSRERHLVLRNQLLRIEQIGVECGCVPDQIGGLHRGRIIVVGRFSRLLAEDARRGSGRASSCRAPASGRLGIFCRLDGLPPHRRRQPSRWPVSGVLE